MRRAGAEPSESRWGRAVAWSEPGRADEINLLSSALVLRMGTPRDKKHNRVEKD
jgi:hypothetical protein